MGILALANTTPAASWQGPSKQFVIEDEIDLGEAGAATADVATLLSIAAGWHVFNVWCEIIEIGDGGASTATVGDGAGADSWDASMNLLAAVGTITFGIGGTDAYVTSGGKFYATADTIDLTLTIASGPFTTGKVKGRALVADMN